VRRLGSAALDLCYVAAGRFDAFWEDHLHAWDIAAASLIAAEAGARVTGYDGGYVDLFRGQIVASNGRLHPDVLQVIRAHYR
jgi:myo-inositol-1(or 4)-monophosphatase